MSLLRICLAVAIFVFFACAESEVSEETGVKNPDIIGVRIVGGDEVTIEEFPFQLAIEGGNVFLCGASIISPNWALTAAHCVYRTPKAWLRVRSGTSFYLKGGIIHQVEKLAWHELYEKNYQDYDVGVILVAEPFRYSASVQAIPLATRPVVAGQDVVASGWGFLEQQQLHRPKTLMAVSLKVVEWNVCRRTYWFLTPRQMCAGSLNKDTCYGDSGGPLIIDKKQVGIISTGYKCANKGQPAVYTNISVVGNWIEKTTRTMIDNSDSIVFPSDR